MRVAHQHLRRRWRRDATIIEQVVNLLLALLQFVNFFRKRLPQGRKGNQMDEWMDGEMRVIEKGFLEKD